MLYWILNWFEIHYHPPGFGAFSYISTRSVLAAATALIISLIIGKYIINWLKKMQLGETIRTDIGLDSHLSKAGTPSMGGLIILLATLLPSVLWIRPGNVYGWLVFFVMLTLGIVGFLDDYIKIIRKNKKGLYSWVKVAGQVLVGLILGLVIYTYPEFHSYNTLTTVPFVKNININYAVLGEALGWITYIPVVIFVITAVSNAVNLTDGLDGLAAGISAIVVLTLGIFCYVSGRTDFSHFLDILYLPGAGELTIFCSALIGACLGFLWYNSYPAQVFMGDTGSLAIGGAIGAVALMVRKELILPILCGVFFLETVSVIIQTTYFKYTKKKYGEGRRYFLMAPIHHHFEKAGWPESKIVVRFWIISVLLALSSLVTLKLR
ncbi:MAG TPA: phospho-N-acetylmuramoyl-pentapeptide-transferase [Balneolales bacterium]|nr:phospho-N-acetylmuramoyl-pentapeptide-transferase [Balneolales bacterium]